MWFTYSQHGAKYLLFHRDRLGVLRLDDGWLDKVSSRIVSVSTTQDLIAFSLRLGNVAGDLLECRFAAIDLMGRLL